jgi:multidrug resistance efflux pump
MINKFKNAPIVKGFVCSFTLTSQILICLTMLSLATNAIAAEIGALGYIAPKDKIVFLVGTPGVEIVDIKVKPHQRVEKGQVLMEFSNYLPLSTKKELAELELKNQKALGPEQINIQESKLIDLQRLVDQTEKHLENYKKLATKAQVATELSRREQSLDDAKHQLELQSLRLLQANRESELGIAQAKLKLKLAKAQLEKGQLIAPRNGVILEIRKQVGETIGGGPTILLADDSVMYAVCDVYESDLLQIKPDMSVTVSSNSLPDKLTGKVERVNQVVDTASRLGKVLVKLDDREIASQLIGLEVHVVIHN